MENSSSFRDRNDQPQWFVVRGSSSGQNGNRQANPRGIGPMTVAEVLEKVEGGELSWADFAWREGESGWIRLCDIAEFQVAAPSAPQLDPQVLVQSQAAKGKKAPPIPPPIPEEESKEWFLYYNQAQFGPFSESEVIRYLKIGKIHGRVHAWKDGMQNWEKIETLPLFAEAARDSGKVRESKREKPAPIRKSPSAPSPERSGQPEYKEQRESPRRPLVARILLTDDRDVIVGICRDISVGGMQVLSDRVPGKPGMHLKFNVSPASEAPSGQADDASVPPFVTEGVIVRILEDGRGFSFRFENLSEQSRRAIESYIASAN